MFGVPSYGSSEVAEDFIDSVYHFATSGHVDPKGSIIPVAQFVSGQDGPDYASTLFYNGDQARPRVLQDFLGQILTPLDGSDTLIPYSLGQYSRDVRPAFEKGGFAYGLRQRFHLIPVIANREAIKLLHDEFFKGALDTFNDTEGGTIGLAFNPITSSSCQLPTPNPDRSKASTRHRLFGSSRYTAGKMLKMINWWMTLSSSLIRRC